MPSPSYQPDSPTNSIPSRDGGQHTPTYPRDSDIPESHISEWDTEDVGTYIASIGLDQYRECFIGGSFFSIHLPLHHLYRHQNPYLRWDGMGYHSIVVVLL
jgi:hypothetical protein